LTRWRRQKVAGNVAHDRLGNVTLHFEDDERVPNANAQREGNVEVNRTKTFNCVVSPSFVARRMTGRHGFRRRKIAAETLGAPASPPSSRSAFTSWV